MLKCVILQPSYIPWRGYFHQIQKADIFVFYDDVQYDKRGWRNRNRIKTPQGSKWLTIPVHSKGVQIERTPLNQVRINWEQPWPKSHWGMISQFYRRAPYFKKYAALFEEFYQRRYEFLADFTIDFTLTIASELGINDTRFIRSSSFEINGNKTDRIIKILVALGADHYISGPSAKEYIEEEKFRDSRISLEYMQYDYPEYCQLYPPYDPFVTILDLLFMTGPEAKNYIWSR